MKNIIVLGASGSIGSQSLDLLYSLKKRYCLLGVSVGENIEFLKTRIIPRFEKLKYICLKNETDYNVLKSQFKQYKFFHGDSGLISLTKIVENNVILNALVGFSGVMPTISALNNNKKVFLANKESLVVAGELIKKIGGRRKMIYPIDSEHAAITKCLKNVNKKDLKTIYLTCSGGPFFFLNKKKFKDIKVEDALKHPTYKMGKKITIDSSTLMNKAFEIIEAHYLFNVKASKIKVKVDRNSYVHSFIELKDGTYKLSVGKADMHIQIADCLSFFKTKNKEFSDTEINTLDKYKFYDVDLNKFPALKYGYFVIKNKGISGLIINAANEIVVEAFLYGIIDYVDITKIIDKILKMYDFKEELTIQNIVKLNKKIRIATSNLIKNKEY